jgi:hypothetical protein
MRIFSFLAMLTFCFNSCKGQQSNSKVKIWITNRSHSVIDSVVFTGLNGDGIGTIGINESRNIELNVSGVDAYQKGIMQMIIYSGGKKLPASWGLHDLGKFLNTEEHVYVFDNGFNIKDKSVERPQELTIILVNKSLSPIDSVTAFPSTLNKLNVQPNFWELKLNFESIQKNPFLNIYQQEKRFKVLIDHDWNNWNNTQEFLYLHNNGIISKNETL